MRATGLEAIVATFALLAIAGHARAQGAAPLTPKPEMIESCPGLVAARPPFVQPAAFQPSQFHLAALARRGGIDEIEVGDRSLDAVEDAGLVEDASRPRRRGIGDLAILVGARPAFARALAAQMGDFRAAA